MDWLLVFHEDTMIINRNLRFATFYRKCLPIVTSFIIILVMGGLPLYSVSASAEPDFSEIDAYIQLQMKNSLIPGVSLAITHQDQIVHLRGFGVADPSGRPMTPQIPMLIGSLSKSFTALGVMQLVEAGRIDLDVPVQRYLPWFRVGSPLNGAADEEVSTLITPRQLLNQVSGFSRLSGEKMTTDGDTSDTALERNVRALRLEHLDRQAGSGFEYSNANYMVLGMVIQASSGQSYEAYVQEHIFKPLEMYNSYTSQMEAQQHGMSAGYNRWFGFPVASGSLPYPRGMVPAGYLITSAEDLGHYLIAQMNQGSYGGVSILSPQGIEGLHAPAVAAAPEGFHKLPSGSYGMGWYVMEMNGISVIAHDGDTPTFHADMILIPAGNWGIALLVNTNTVLMGDDIRNLFLGVDSLLDGKQPTPAPVSYPAIFLFIFMLAFLGFEIYNLVRLAVTWKRPPKITGQTHTFRFWFRPCVLPLMIGLMAACWMLLAMPVMFQATWPVMLLHQPDLSWIIFLGGFLALFNGILRSGGNAWKLLRRSAL
jgi:CubicO group peptidase (beta-lactamase class C family)